MDVWLGEFSDIDELDASWQTFLATMQRLVRLVALHVREGPEGAASTWINPDCIGVLQPILSTTGTTSVLRAQLKLEGLPLMDAWLGEFSDQATADAGWRSFLTEVHGDSPSAS